MAYIDITSTGTKVVIQDMIYPSGYTIKQGAVDSPFVSGSDAITIGTSSVGINNDHVNHRTPSLLQISIAVIPDSEDDKALQVSATYNRSQNGEYNPNATQIVITEPQGTMHVLANCAMNVAPFINTANADGSKATKVYVFEGVSKVL